MRTRYFAPLAIVLALATPAWAQFTPAQVTAIQAAITADPVLAAIPNTYPAGAEALAAALNANAAPTFTVWKTNVSIGDVGRAFNGTELAGLTTGNQTRLQTIALYLTSGVNPSISGNRAFFDDVFSGAGGTNTRAALLALWKRPARYIEKILATGTGSDASPGTIVFEGAVNPAQIHNARNAGQ